MRIKRLFFMLWTGLWFFSGMQAHAQGGNGLDNPDWVEEAAAPPPARSPERLIPIDMPPHISVSVGVDPASIVVGGDGVVRYVLVMRNTSGSTTAVYEGIRCASNEVKTYARMNTSGVWALSSKPDWKDLHDGTRSLHAKAFARQGGCQNRLASNTGTIIAALKSAQRHDSPLNDY